MANFKPSLDTLALSGTECVNGDFGNLSNTTSRGDKTTLQKRARSKSFSHATAVGLVEASEKTDSELIKSYWSSYHCAGVICEHQDGKVSTRYCKTKWCLVCSRIKTAKLINQYRDNLTEWLSDDEVYFITLTRLNVNSDELSDEVKAINKLLSQIAGTIKKRAQRKSGEWQPFIAIRKTECTYNDRRQDYHPHLHIIVKGKQNAQTVIDEWIKRNQATGKKVDAKAQDIRRVNEVSDAIELFKYATKMITKSQGRRKVELAAMHTIYSAFAGIKTLQPYGFKMSGASDVSDSNKQPIIGEYEWQQSQYDWVKHDIEVDCETGEVLGVSEERLSGYNPGAGMRDLLQNGFEINGKRINTASPPDSYLNDIYASYRRSNPQKIPKRIK